MIGNKETLFRKETTEMFGLFLQVYYEVIIPPLFPQYHLTFTLITTYIDYHLYTSQWSLAVINDNCK